MRIRIFHKVVAGLLAVAAVGAISGISGRIAVDGIAADVTNLASRDLPLEQVAVAAKQSTTEAILALREFLSQSTDLVNSSDNLREKLTILELQSAMLRMGAGSAEFKEAGYQSLLDERSGLVSVTEPARANDKELADDLEDARVQFAQAAEELLSRHVETSQYIYDMGGSERNISSLLEYVTVDLNSWLNGVEDAAKFEAVPNVVLTIEETFYGRWRERTGPLPSPELEELAVKLDKNYGKLIAYARDKVFEAKPSKRNSQFVRMLSRRVPKAVSSLGNFRDAARQHMSSLLAAEAEGLERVEQTASLIGESAEELRRSVAGKVATAVAAVDATVEQAQWQVLASAGAGLGLTILLAMGVARALCRPLRQIVQTTLKLAEGEFETEISGSDRNDELGDMARALRIFRDNGLRQRELEAKEEEIRNLRDAESQRINDIVASFEAQASQWVAELTRACQEHESEILRGCQETVEHVLAVSSATEEISKSINDISNQTTRSADIATDAAENSKQTQIDAAALAEASESVTHVISLIEDIAEQTNLLALNATIEAARAGDAGKGFAVVAGEVKNLATQTATATQDIRQQVETLKYTTTQIATAIDEIAKKISESAQANSAVAVAVEQQALSSKQIASNTDAASAVSRSSQDHAKESIELLLSSNHNLEQGIQSFLRQLSEARKRAA